MIVHLILSLTETSKMEGNDFIIFKHGCGEDSKFYTNETRCKYTGWYDPDCSETLTETRLTEDAKAKFDKPCKNFIFYHVEVEYIGDESFTYDYEK